MSDFPRLDEIGLTRLVNRLAEQILPNRNVQSDWNESDSTSDAYIKNKPSSLTDAYFVSDSASTTVNNTDYVPMSENGGTKKKVLWSTIIAKVKSAIGISSSGDTFLKKDGTWGLPPTQTAGHTILNTSGTAMTQRTNLQFEGMDVTDDSTNNKTKVTPRLDSMPIENSVKGVQSGGTYAAIQNSAFCSFRTQSATNCVNVLKSTIKSQVVNGITVTVKGYDESLPGTFTLNGTATADIYLQVGCITKTSDAGGYGVSFKLRGCPSGGGSNTYYLYEGDASTEVSSSIDYGNGGSIGTESSYKDAYYDENTYMQIWLYVKSRTTINNKTFYPIVYPCYGFDPFNNTSVRTVADMWVPYTRSNDALTRDRDHLEMADYDVASSTTEDYAKGAFNVQSFSQIGKVPGQPSQYGFMQTMSRGWTPGDRREIHQLWFTQDNGSMYHRGTNYNSYNNPPAFKEILDSANYSNHTHVRYLYFNSPTVTEFVQGTNSKRTDLTTFFLVRDMNAIFGSANWFKGYVQYQNAYDSSGDVQGYGIVSAQDDLIYELEVHGTGSSFTITLSAIVTAKGGLLNTDGVIHKVPSAAQWIKDREKPVIKTDTMPDANGYIPILSIKVSDGTWSLGTLGRDLYFNFVKDSDYNSNTNTSYRYKLVPPAVNTASLRPAEMLVSETYSVTVSTAQSNSTKVDWGTKTKAGYKPIMWSELHNYAGTVVFNLEGFTANDGSFSAYGYGRKTDGTGNVTYLLRVLWLQNS